MFCFVSRTTKLTSAAGKSYVRALRPKVSDSICIRMSYFSANVDCIQMLSVKRERGPFLGMKEATTLNEVYHGRDQASVLKNGPSMLPII